jgi:hypothetical protein
LANGSSNFDIATANGNVTLTTAGAKTWTFGTDGNVTIPAGGAIQTAPGSAGNILIHPDTGGALIIQGNAVGGFGALVVVQSNTANALNRIEVDTFGTSNVLGGTFIGRFARGNLTAPQAVQNNDRLVGFKGKGFDGTVFPEPSGQITIDAVGNWSSNNHGTHISFWTTPSGFTTIQESARLYSIGDYHQIIGNIIVEAGNISATGNITGNNITTGNQVITTPVALANLTAVAGARAFVNNANLVAAGNFGNQISSGGSNTVPVWSDGTNWYIG